MINAPLFEHVTSGRLGLEPAAVARELQATFDAASAADPSIPRRPASIADVIGTAGFAVGYQAYSRSAPPTPGFGQTATEVAPVNGVQTWALQASTAPLATLVGEIVAAIGAQFAVELARGLTYQGQVIQLDDASRANLGALGTTAGLVIQGVLPTWPPDYARGWISAAGVRIPLATPQEGLTLATGAGARYAALVQHEVDLINAAQACTTLTALAAIDPTAGWPA